MLNSTKYSVPKKLVYEPFGKSAKRYQHKAHKEYVFAQSTLRVAATFFASHYYY